MITAIIGLIGVAVSVVGGIVKSNKERDNQREAIQAEYINAANERLATQTAFVIQDRNRKSIMNMLLVGGAIAALLLFVYLMSKKRVNG
jgi:hypothetical protein